MNLGASTSRISSLKRCLIILIVICLTLSSLLLLLLSRQMKGVINPKGLITLLNQTYLGLENKYGNDTLVDFQGFQFLKQNDQLCPTNRKNKSNNLMLILILSSPQNLNNRKVIRQTWGSLTSIGNWDIRYAFLLGFSSTSTSGTNISAEIRDEFDLNQDLIIGNFIDSYRHLSYKQLMGYKWALRYCSEAKYVVKTDDDVFVDTFQLVRYVDSLINHDKIILGYVNYRSYPQRTPGSKWFVTAEEFPEETYPDYCMGMGCLMSFDVIKALYEASETVPYFWVEDVFVTGILREVAEEQLGIEISLIDLNKEYIFSDGLDDRFILWLYQEKCLEKEFPWMFVHFWGEEIPLHFEQLWNYVVKFNLGK